MSLPAVEVVVVHWKRPGNLPRIVEAFRRQTAPCTLTLLDCHPEGEPEFALDAALLKDVDRVYRLNRNLGGYNRYVPSAAYDHEYTYFSDDDLLPGSRCLEHFLEHACGRRFGVLGQFGRRFKPDMVYRPRKVPRTHRMEEVDLVVQSYFVPTRYLGHVAAMRWDLGLAKGTILEDDVLLAVAMQVRAGLGCFLTPESDDPETSAALEKLPSPFAISARPEHHDSRTALFAQARRSGWKPLGARRATPLVWAARGGLLAAEKQVRAWRDLRGGQSP